MQKCLIVERHAWETGFSREQLQIPLPIARKFFGSGKTRRRINVRIAGAQQNFPCAITREYPNGTRRLDGLPLVGLLGTCFVFLQETGDRMTYDLWCNYDKALVAARYYGWHQARNSQYGRGRLAIIVSGAVPHDFDHLPS
ncbi:MAG TPA: hypothetical protein VHD62_10895 [Opitutaceae bacterium]|nr:hypothetical protein [Opitutaceae bacterium]